MDRHVFVHLTKIEFTAVVCTRLAKTEKVENGTLYYATSHHWLTIGQLGFICTMKQLAI